MKPFRIGFGCFGVLFVLYLLFVPVKLSVQFPEKFVYLDEPLTEKTMQVSYQTLVGIRYPAHDVYYIQNIDDVVMVKVWAGSFAKTVKRPVIRPVDYQIAYDGTVYAGQSLLPSKLSIQAVYENDVVRPLSNLQVTTKPVPMMEHGKIPILTECGTVFWETDAVVPSDIQISYDETAQQGDMFDRRKVQVVLQYADGTSCHTKEFTVSDAPGYLTGEMAVTVLTPYGTTELKFVPQNAQLLKASYDGVVYQGTSLKKEQVTLSYQLPDGSVKDLSDFELPNLGKILTHTKAALHSSFGDGVLNVQPVLLREVRPVMEGELVEGKKPNILGIQLVYADDTVVDVSLDKVSFLSLPDTWKAGENRVYLKVRGLYRSFVSKAIPKSIVLLRKDVLDVAKTYDLTEEQLKTIAILCQRSVSDDLEALSMEASYLANQYEASGGGDGAGLLDYAIHSGLFGEDAASYVSGYQATEDSQFVIQDVLVHGHRSLPAYINQRCTSARVKEKNSEQYESDETEILLEDGKTFRYYQFASSDSEVLYGYTAKRYQEVTGTLLKTSNPRSAKKQEMSDDGILIE